MGLAEALTKKNMKAIKFILGMGLMLAASSAFSQGLQGIVVEKYYQANAADVADATTATTRARGILPVQRCPPNPPTNKSDPSILVAIGITPLLPVGW